MERGGISSIIGFVLIILSIIFYLIYIILYFRGFVYPFILNFIFSLIFGYIICFVNVLRLESGWPRKLSKVGVLISILILFIISVILLIWEYSSKGLLSTSFFGLLLSAILIIFGAVLLMGYNREKSKKIWKVLSIIFGVLFLILIVLLVIYSLIFGVILLIPQ